MSVPLTQALDMRRTYLATIYSIMSIAALSACASIPPAVAGAPIILPERAEPKFERASYDSLPGNAKMVVRRSYWELEAQLKARLPALSTNRLHARLSFVGEEAIVFGGEPYRRIWLSYVDGSEPGLHGPNSQNIYLWLLPSGEISEVYVSPLLHPL